MTSDPMARRTLTRWTKALAVPLLLSVAAAGAGAQARDPRIGLGAGYTDAKEASRGLELIAHRDRPTGFVNTADVSDFGFANSDLAFSGTYAFQGNYNGFQVWDISNPASPTLRTSFVCTGGQGDLSVYKNLLFMSVEERRGRTDCGPQGVADTVSTERFRGVRIFDISDIDRPKQVAMVQTCRGSHTHTLVPDPNDPKNIYVYVSGTSVVRPGAELAGCSDKSPAEDPNTSLFRIDIIRVPLAAPQKARIIASPRIFATGSDIAGLWKGGTHGPSTQETEETNQCHDITVYPAMGLAAGACSGNGILLDIRDPARPKRISEVVDPNFAYWHSATFSNDAKKVLYSDEWGGGGAPRCQATDRLEWGSDAIFTVDKGKLSATPAGHFKLPAAQTETENCVAHNGSLIPVPGRDLMVQSWYQGGISVFDFTNPARPTEIAFFDRGPVDAAKLALGGHWSAYWYNGSIIGSEILRGLDVLKLTPSANLSQNEIDAAMLVRMDRFNPQMQTKLVWPANIVVARAYLDQLERVGGDWLPWVEQTRNELAEAEQLNGAQRRGALSRLATLIDADANGSADPVKVRAIAATVRGLARR
jgi:hypothetical protein